METYKVIRPHLGDQFYDPSGEQGPAERQAEPTTVAHLVASGVLRAPENKALSGSPETKDDNAAEAARLAAEEAERKAAEEAEAARLAAEKDAEAARLSAEKDAEKAAERKAGK